MGYQALLFCPDEKLARVVSQVFTELDFTIEPVHEPFAAVKKLMAQRYDAIVVDCENEQNASLLFKSARNSGSNQNSLAIAVVEGQAGVAKAYRIGANLVLTKPINVEQAKGTLRVARGLLRKNSDAAAGAAPQAAAQPKPAPPVAAPQPASRVAPPTVVPARPAEAPAARPADVPRTIAAPPAVPAIAAPVEASGIADAATPVIAAQTENWPASEITVENETPLFEADEISSAISAVTPSHLPAFGSATGSAAAPAPAKEVPAASSVKAQEAKAVESKAAELKIDPKVVEIKSAESSIAELEPAHEVSITSGPTFGSQDASSAPSFAALGDEDESSSGGSKKILIAVAILVLAALGYFGYAKLSKPATPAPASAPQSVAEPAPAPQPSTATPAASTDIHSPAIQSQNAKPTAASPAEKPISISGSTPAIKIAANTGTSPAPETNAGPAPILVKSNPTGTASRAQTEESAPQLPNQVATSSTDKNIAGLMASSSPALPKVASATTLRVSQGVSQGLLIKRVAPKYPPAALAVRSQGAVEIEATVDKEGNVINPKVLKGDPILAHAAIEAVRQWRYKPYYLDGQPVEIQTQITINFKTN